MNIIKNTINIGIEKPLTFLHMTDTHITFTDSNDTDERRKFADGRKEEFFKACDVNYEFALDYAKKTGYPIVHTGDFFDFITPENLKEAKKFADETGMLLIAGNHEFHNCVNNKFCEADSTEDLKIKETTLDKVQNFFNNDIRFFAKEFNGVMLVGIDNSDYQIRGDALEALKDVVKMGKPIILFMHIPLATPHFIEKFGNAIIALPDEIINTFKPFRIFEMKANAVTVSARDYIVSEPLIKAVISGHLHYNYETPIDTEVKQYLTDCNTLREITII